MLRLLAIVVLSFAATVQAQEPFILEDSTGQYLIYPSPSGPIVIPVNDLKVVPWGQGPPTTPTDPSAFAKEVSDWASVIADPHGAQIYSLIWMMAAEGLKGGQLTPDNIVRYLGVASDRMLTAKWRPVRDQIGNRLAEMDQDGLIGTDTQWINFSKTVQHGLTLSASGEDSITADEQLSLTGNLNKIIEEIND